MAKADSNNPIDEVKNNLDVSYFFVFIDLAFSEEFYGSSTTFY